MFALWPILPLAFAALILSVAYEGEIYFQNIKGALNKLFFKRDYLKNYLGNEFLLKSLLNSTDENEPQFFKDYKAQLKLLHKFTHKNLDQESLARKKRTEKIVRDMEKWFANELFSSKESNLTPYQKELRDWLKANKQDEVVNLFNARKKMFVGVTVFSVISGVFMGLGTTYLLVEVFTIVPLLAGIPFGILPLIVIPMALIAGAAYCFLIYNAVTDMINNDTLRKWYHKIRDSFKEGVTFRNVISATTSIILLSLAIALTICTAGTWWTVAKNARPIFNWMMKLPGFLMGVINPLITGASALIFNVQNTSETFELIEKTLKGNIFQRTWQHIVTAYNNLRDRENWLQLLNPFRILLKLTVTPLRILLFLGHLISIGVTADRVPGIPVILSALLGIISEGFEDLHYFAGHEHEPHEHKHGHAAMEDMLKERLEPGHSHNHGLDLPTRLLKWLFAPLYFVAALWDYAASQKNNDSKRCVIPNLSAAWKKQQGEAITVNVVQPTHSNALSDQWKVEHAVHKIERLKQKHLLKATIKPAIAALKVDGLTNLQSDLRGKSSLMAPQDFIASYAEEPIFNQHRLFKTAKTTRTKACLDNLATDVGFEQKARPSALAG